MKKMIMIFSLLTILSMAYATIDLGVTEILPGTIYYGTSANIFPNVKVHNYGDETVDEFDVNVVITDGTQDVYNFTKTVMDIVLNAGEETFISMDELWSFDDPNASYEITATVIIANDTNPNNNELSENCDIIQFEYTEDAYALKYVFYQDKTFGSIDLESGDYSIISDVGLALALKARGADFANGVMYGVVSTYGGAYPRELHIMQSDGQDINLGDITSEDFLDNEYISGITYDYDNHIFYIITTCWGEITPRLYTINQFTLEAKFIGQMNDLQFMSIEYAEGVLYGIEVQQLNLHQIDMETAESTEIGSLGINYVALDQCLSYDASSGIMYGTFYNDITGSSFRTVNLETGNTTQIQGYGDTFNLIYFAINTEPLLSYENDILSFSIPEQVGETVIDDVEHTVELEVSTGTNVTALVPTIEISDLATIFPESGVSQDFTNPVEYTVIAENGDEQVWMVTVSVQPSSENDIISFSIPEQIGETVIDDVEHTVQLYIPAGSNITTLIPTIGISENATIFPESGTPQDFTDPVEYSVTAQNGDEQIWLAAVTLLVSSEDHLIPSVTKLIGNYPNPFNPTTTITYSLTTESIENTELVIYNLKGQKIKTFSLDCHPELVEGSIIWNGTDDNNQPVSSGVYLYKLQAGEFSQTKKMILMK